MILNRTGAEFEYEGVTYTIGGAIVGTAESEYAGLYGRINAIHDGEDMLRDGIHAEAGEIRGQ